MVDDGLAYAAPGPLALLRVERRLAAPREQVYRAWTDPEAVAQWFGQPTSSRPTVEADVRVGGRFAITWGGADVPGRIQVSGTYLEVDAPKRLVYTFAWKGMPPEYCVADSKVTVEFTEVADEVEVRLTHELLDEEAILGFHRWGWDLSFDRLAQLLGSASSG